MSLENSEKDNVTLDMDINNSDESHSGAPIDFNAENPLEKFKKVGIWLEEAEKKRQEEEKKRQEAEKERQEAEKKYQEEEKKLREEEEVILLNRREENIESQYDSEHIDFSKGDILTEIYKIDVWLKNCKIDKSFEEILGLNNENKITYDANIESLEKIPEILQEIKSTHEEIIANETVLDIFSNISKMEIESNKFQITELYQKLRKFFDKFFNYGLGLVVTKENYMLVLPCIVDNLNNITKENDIEDIITYIEGLQESIESLDSTQRISWLEDIYMQIKSIKRENKKVSEIKKNLVKNNVIILEENLTFDDVYHMIYEIFKILNANGNSENELNFKLINEIAMPMKFQFGEQCDIENILSEINSLLYSMKKICNEFFVVFQKIIFTRFITYQVDNNNKLGVRSFRNYLDNLILDKKIDLNIYEQIVENVAEKEKQCQSDKIKLSRLYILFEELQNVCLDLLKTIGLMKDDDIDFIKDRKTIKNLEIFDSCLTKVENEKIFKNSVFKDFVYGVFAEESNLYAETVIDKNILLDGIDFISESRRVKNIVIYSVEKYDKTDDEETMRNIKNIMNRGIIKLRHLLLFWYFVFNTAKNNSLYDRISEIPMSLIQFETQKYRLL